MTESDRSRARGVRYQPQLDGLRFFAFLLVFFCHAAPATNESWATHGLGGEGARWATAITQAGAFGVDVFFVLSSYLITSLLLRETEVAGKVNLPAFLVRRALRIWPLYFGFLFPSLAWAFLRGNPEIVTKWGVWYAIFAGNWACAALGYPHSAIAPLWSVSIEEQFYVAWPLALAYVLPGPTPRHLLRAAAVMVGSATAMRVGCGMAGVAPVPIWVNTIARLDPIAVGIALAALRLPPHPLNLSRPGLLAVGLLLLPFVARFAPTDRASWLGLTLGYPTVAMAAGMLLLGAHSDGTPPTDLFRRALGSRPAVYLGRISYGLYVFHALALEATRDLRLNGGLRVALALVVTASLAVLSYELMERRFLRLKTRFSIVSSRPEP